MPPSTTNPEPWSGVGLMQSFIKLKEGSKLSQETLDEWLDEVYMPAILATGEVSSAWRWRAANPSYDKQQMLIYKVPELASVQQGGKIKDVPRTSGLFPTEGPVDDFIEFESRVLGLVQYIETEKQPEGLSGLTQIDAATTMIYAAMQPAPGGEADLDAWYRKEHNQQMSEQPGWKRTTRFSLLFHMRNDGKQPGGLDFLAIHEFGEGHKLSKDVEALQPISDWTKKCMSECTAIDAAVYHEIKSFGKAASL